MYNTSQEWKQKIYENVQSILNIYINNELVDANYVLDFKVGQTLFDEELTLGSVSSKYIEFKIYRNQVPENISQVKVDYGILINGEYEIIPIGIFNVDEWTDNDDNTLTIKCIDNMSKFEFNYDGSTLTYPATLIQILQDICNKAGVELGSTSFLNSNTQISVYDNTVTAREYLSYISECAGGFALIGRDGKLYIRTIYQDEQEIPLDLFGEYKWGDKCTISKVSYENGVESFKFGNDSDNNLWINQDNMYIVDEDEVENIYNQINGLTAYSFEGKTIIDPALDVGDKIIIDGKPVIYQGEADFQGRFIVEISSKIAIKEKQETTIKEPSQKLINRRVQSRIDEAEGKITQLVEENTEQSKKITEVEQTVDGISQKVQDIEDVTETITGITSIELDNCYPGVLLSLHIIGNNTVFEQLYPADDLFPSDDLYPYGDSRIIVTDEKGNQKEYELNVTDVLREKDGIYDEYVLEKEQAKIIRRINEDGTIKETEEEEDLGTLTIMLEKGKNTIKIKNYEASIIAKYAIQNDYTDIFATKVEMDSSIEQSAQEIDLSVNKKLEEYSTTEEMKAEIKITADEINSEVSKKVGEDEVISKINQSAEQIQIIANKVSLEREGN